MHSPTAASKWSSQTSEPQFEHRCRAGLVPQIWHVPVTLMDAVGRAGTRLPGPGSPPGATGFPDSRAGNALWPDGLRPAVTRNRLLLAVASVLAGAAALFVVLGAVSNLVLVAAALPFGLAAYFIWLHATGRIEARVRRRRWPAGGESRARERWTADRGRRARRARRAADARGGRTASGSADVAAAASMDRREALRTLGLDPGADQASIRRAYRERVKAVHPDASDGDEAAFRRLTAAYDRLRDR